MGSWPICATSRLDKTPWHCRVVVDVVVIVDDAVVIAAVAIANDVVLVGVAFAVGRDCCW